MSDQFLVLEWLQMAFLIKEKGKQRFNPCSEVGKNQKLIIILFSDLFWAQFPLM
jgi:hypothetical protein